LVVVAQALPPAATVADLPDLVAILQLFLQSLQQVAAVVVLIGRASA
jgi:hypothetical protein